MKTIIKEWSGILGLVLTAMLVVGARIGLVQTIRLAAGVVGERHVDRAVDRIGLHILGAIHGRRTQQVGGATRFDQDVEDRLDGSGIIGQGRSPLLPDVPTVAETVIPKFEVGAWSGVMAPARTPAPVVRRLYTEIAKAMTTPELKERMAAEGLDPAGGPPSQLADMLKREIPKWIRVVKEANVKTIQ